MVTKKALTYNSDSIKTLRFPDNVRSNPSMYLGSVDAAGVFLTVRELLDNFIDEAMAKRATKGWLHIDKDGSYWVHDDGKGVPQGIKTFTLHVNGKDVKSKMPTMQAVFGELHTSGKYRDDAYATSVGTHGIGAKGTNATALFFDVFTFYEGKWYTIGFKKGRMTQPVASCKAPKGPDGKLVKSGTLIHFKPDSEIFTVKSFPPAMAVEWATIMSYLNPNVAIRLSSAKNDKTFISKRGITEYIEHRLKQLKVDAENVEKILFQHSNSLADVIVAFSGHDAADVRGFTNGLFNSDGGKHVDSVTGALYKGLGPFIKTKRVDGKPVPLFREADLKEGMVGLVNAKLHKAQFNSQDKAKLVDARVGADFEAELTAVATKFFATNKALATRLCERATKINELKSKFTASKAMVTALNKLKREGMPHNYAAPDGRTKVEDRELFIVEGDSAAGGVRKTKRAWQALLPLTGKILNVMKAKSADKALLSKAVVNILGAIGFDPKAADPLKKLTVGRIICLADPDPDGPFIGGTEITFRLKNGLAAENGGYHKDAIELLANYTKNNVQFEVPVFHGGKEIWADATAALVKNVDSIIALDIGKSKYRVDASHRFVVVKTRALYGREQQPFEGDARLAYVRSEHLKIGDRVYCPENNGTRDQSITDKETGLGYMPVSKLRTQKLDAPIPVYCVTVPKYHHFVLPSGIVSGNCHINSLLLTLFYKMAPDLFNSGMVYMADIPEFYTIYKDELVTGDTLSEVQKRLRGLKAPQSHPVSHIKGWGEVDSDLIEMLAVDARSRRIIQIKPIEHEDKTDFVRLMNEDVQYRKDIFNLPGAGQPSKVAAKRVPKAANDDTAATAAKRVPVKKARAVQDEQDGRPPVKKAPIKKAPLRAVRKVARKAA